MSAFRFESRQFDTKPFAMPHFRVRRFGPHASATQGGFLPNEEAAVYGATRMKRVTSYVPAIYIPELGGGENPSDTKAAFAAMGLPAPDVTHHSVMGATNSPGNDADGEVALDIQEAAGWYSAIMGEPANVHFGWTPNSGTGFPAGIAYARQVAAAVGAAVLSGSWGSPEEQQASSYTQAMEAALQANAQAGVANFMASGDGGATDGTGRKVTDYPAASPWSIGCGGTSLVVAGSTFSEKSWLNGGGGLSALFRTPAYQQGIALCTTRGVPDVSGNADPQTARRVIVNGRWQLVGGTSAVAPMWAGLTAAYIACGGNTQNFLARLYALPQTCFNDVTAGNNSGYNAGPGYDLNTGRGTPRVPQLFAGLGLGGDTHPPPPPPPPANRITTNATLKAGPIMIFDKGWVQASLAADLAPGTHSLS